MSLDVQIHGIEELNRKLKLLTSSKAAKRIARKAARQAMNIVRDAARTNAKAIDDPETAEKIWKNIAVSGGKSRNSNEVVMRVGVRGGAKNYVNSKDNVRKGRAGKEYATDGSSKNPGGDTFYWRYIEFGTSRFPAVPFMRPALSENIERVTVEFNKTFMKSIETAIKKGKIT